MIGLMVDMVHEAALQLLAVEDNTAVAAFLKRYFEVTGHKITVVGELYAARQELQHQPYDIVLLDLMLPDGNGIDFLREIHAAYPQMPVIIMSGMQQAVTQQDALREGAAGFLAKPFQLQDVGSLVERICKFS
jgi:DNA-binding NtrC family response regulator